MGENPAVGADNRQSLTDAVAKLASIVLEEGPPEPVLQQVAQLARDTLPAVEEVSVTLVEQGHPRSVVFTGRLAVDLDERQYETGFGPCLDAARSGETISVGADEEDTPYRAYATLAARSGVRQTTSFGLPVNGRSIGGLNVYRSVDDALSDADLAQVQAFVGFAAVAVNNVARYTRAARETEHLRQAMDSRAVIEQAKGIIIAREGCTPDDAFALLARMSQHTHVKLRDVAARIVASAHP
jgi:GAF domain-containing protein